MKVSALLPLPLVVVSGVLGCQLLYNKNDLTTSTGGGGTTSTTSSGGTTSTTPAGGTGGSTGGTTASGGTTGSGGNTGGTTGSGGDTGGTPTTTTTTTTTDTTTTTTTTTTVSCDEPLLVVATSTASKKVLCATYSAAGTWTPTVAPGVGVAGRPTAALLDAQTGLGAYYDGAVPGSIRWVELANGVCKAPAAVPTITAKDSPTSAVLSGTVHMLFQGAEGTGINHPYARRWTPAGGWVDGGQVGLWTGAAVPGIGAGGAEMLAVHGRTSPTADSAVTRTVFANGTWGTEDCFQANCVAPLELTKAAVTPAIAGLSSGGWVVVFQDFDPGTPKLRWVTVTGAGVASPSTVVRDAAMVEYPLASPDPPSLWPTADGAVMAYRRTNGEVVTGFYTAATNTWSTAAVIPGVTTPASPAVAHGTCSHLVFVNNVDGKVAHCAHDGTSWTCDAAAISAETMTGVAIASPP